MTRRHLLPVWAAVVLTTIATATRAAGPAAPVVDYLFPAGGQQGAQVHVTTGAKIDPWPAKVWTDTLGLAFEADSQNGTFIAKIAKDCPIGPHLVRVYNQEGASSPRIFVVDRHAELLEKEPNDSREAAQLIEKLPVIMNGQLEKPGDVDCFAVDATVGQWIIADLTCHRLSSPVDPAIHLLDPDGIEIAFNHDTFGLDPLISWQVKKPGRYVIQVAGFGFPPTADVRFFGSKAVVYRLLVTHGPYARYAFPAGVRRGRQTPLHLFGWSLGTSGNAVSLDFEGQSLSARQEIATVSSPLFDSFLRLPVDDLPAQLEIEPNDVSDIAQRVDVPSITDGRLDHAGDIDRFRFIAKRGDRLLFAVKSSALDFPLDPVLTLEDNAGKQLATADDTGPSPDPRLDWTAPADADYVAVVADRFGKGGNDYVYRFEIRKPLPDFTASADVSFLRIEPGHSAQLQVTVARQNGNVLPLAVVIEGLPATVSAVTGLVLPAGGPVKIPISAAAGSPPFNGPIHAMVVSLDADHPAIRNAAFTIAADQILSTTDSLWLTVPPAKPTTKPTTKPAE